MEMNSLPLLQLKVLYVEDDQDTREDLKQYLRKKVGKVITACDGEEGFRKFKEESPDLIIADILLPKLNGIDMIRKIRESGGKCPVIITSSVDETNTIIDAVDVGIVKYVVKPIILENLMEALQNLAKEIQKTSTIYDDVGQKLELENKVKQAVTAFLKKTVGKGPRDLTVFISESNVSINVFGILTTLEKKILENRHNVSLIQHFRQCYYDVSKAELEFIISDILGVTVEFLKVEFDTIRGNERIEFAIA